LHKSTPQQLDVILSADLTELQKQLQDEKSENSFFILRQKKSHTNTCWHK
jgi:hypothetical protein